MTYKKHAGKKSRQQRFLGIDTSILEYVDANWPLVKYFVASWTLDFVRGEWLEKMNFISLSVKENVILEFSLYIILSRACVYMKITSLTGEALKSTISDSMFYRRSIDIIIIK